MTNTQMYLTIIELYNNLDFVISKKIHRKYPDEQ